LLIADKGNQSLIANHQSSALRLLIADREKSIANHPIVHRLEFRV
jgi:hypothetical protein